MSTETIAPAVAGKGLEHLRREVPAHLISKLPRITCRDCSRKSCNNKQHAPRRCEECKGWLSPVHVHLDYVGHAETTDALLEADPGWFWEPMAFDSDGLPKFAADGGLWIRLTLCGVTRIGYGSADNGGFKSKGDVVKEIIGDALRNAAMRFGWALNLWAKTDLNERQSDSDDSSGLPDQAPTVAAIQRKAQRSRSAPQHDEFAVHPAAGPAPEDEGLPSGEVERQRQHDAQQREPWETDRPDRPSPTAGRGAPATDPQIRKLQAMMSGWSRDEKHGVLAVILGRPVASQKELTLQDATVAIDALNKRRDELIARIRGQAPVDAEPAPVQGEQLLADLTAAIETAPDRAALSGLWSQANSARGAGMLDEQQFAVLDQLGQARAEELAQPVGSAA